MGKMVPDGKIRETPRGGVLAELRAERQRRQQFQSDNYALQTANDRLVEMCCFLLRHRPPLGKELAAQLAMGTSVDEAAVRKASLASEFEYGIFWGWFAGAYGNSELMP